jgi:putative transposase
MTRESKLAMIDEDFVNHLSFRKQFDLLGLNRSSYYSHLSCDSSSKNELKLKFVVRIKEICSKYPFFGYRKVTAMLRNEGFTVNHKRIQSITKELNLFAIRPKKNQWKKIQESKVYPYLLKNLEITSPNQVWSTDITYIRMPIGWIYFLAILDLHSRFILSFAVSTSLEAEFCVKALNDAISKHRAPQIFNTDQGTQFTSQIWTDLLTKNNIRISMDGKGRCFDNIRNERLWRTLKYEEVYLKSYDSVTEARQELSEFVKFYNWTRPHQSLSYKTPADVYFADNKKIEPGK